MQSSVAPAYKDYDIPSFPGNAAAASPGSCSSTGPQSLSRTPSSDSSSLLCTEEDIDGLHGDTFDNFAEDIYESWASWLDANNFFNSVTDANVDMAELSRSIRDDLRKQRGHSSSSAHALPRRLPALHRARIVGWMRQVSSALGLSGAALFAATSLLDRFVGAVPELPPDTLLQLLALAAMAVAVKYEEVEQIAPSVWLSLAVDWNGRPLYQSADLQRMEWVLLQTLDWRLHSPNTHSFMQLFLMCMMHADELAAPAAATAAAIGRAGAASSVPAPSLFLAPASCGAATPASQGDARSTHTRSRLDCAAAAAADADASNGGAVVGGSGGGDNSMDTDSAATVAYDCHPHPHHLHNRAHSYHQDAVLQQQAQQIPLPVAQPVAAVAATPASPSSPAAAAAASSLAAAAGEAVGLTTWRPVACRAAVLAELSLMHESFLSYEYSTVALACVVLAEHKVSSGAGGAPQPAPCPRVVAAACAAAGAGLHRVAPGLTECVMDLDRCYTAMSKGDAEVRL